LFKTPLLQATDMTDVALEHLGKLLNNIDKDSIEVLVKGSTVGVTLATGVVAALGKEQFVGALTDTVSYYRSLWYFLRGGSLKECRYFRDRKQARLQTFSLALVSRIWSRRHYRSGTFHLDMRQNLSNVAIPGTGLPLSVVVKTKAFGYLFLFMGYPAVAAVAALNRGRKGRSVYAACAAYREQLLTPQDWFSFWQMNCRLATWHSSITNETDYGMEDKWTFLTTAEKLGISVTPSMTTKAIVCKHRNEEGGLGFACFRNARYGGDWIIQERLENGNFIKSLMPINGPLSTFRVISASRGGLRSGTPQRGSVDVSDIEALSCVWRAGLAGAETDHSSILFNVDPKTGVFKKGTTNNHWYRRGVMRIFDTPWLSDHVHTVHPDTGTQVTGVKVPNIEKMKDFVRDAHLKMMPHVPLAGWDVALVHDTDEMVLLEANLSCNFFRGDFDKSSYFQFLEDYFLDLEQRERQSGTW